MRACKPQKDDKDNKKRACHGARHTYVLLLAKFGHRPESDERVQLLCAVLVPIFVRSREEPRARRSSGSKDTNMALGVHAARAPLGWPLDQRKGVAKLSLANDTKATQKAPRIGCRVEPNSFTITQDRAAASFNIHLPTSYVPHPHSPCFEPTRRGCVSA